jgi:hypothetical protein
VSNSVPQPSEVVNLPLSVGEVSVIVGGDEPYIVFRPAVESLGLSYPAQYRKLKSRSWACVAQKATQVPGDDQRRNVDYVTVSTFLMWLVTINENRVSEQARPALIAYQSETMDAIAAYWTHGGAVNPRADRQQIEALKQRLEELEDDANAWRVLASGNDNYCVRVAANILNQDPAISTGQNRLFKLLYDWKMINKKKQPINRNNGRLTQRPWGDYHEKETGDIRSGKAQLRVTPRGLQYLHKRMGGTQPVSPNLSDSSETSGTDA